MRIGWGFDAHRFGGDPPLVLGGVTVDRTRGLVATSDGDVAAHALADALLGAGGLGDLGSHFPSSDPRWAGADSVELLRLVAGMADDAGIVVEHADVTIIAEDVRVAPFRDAIRAGLASALGIDVAAVSVKATTTDGLGFIGRDEGVAATAVLIARTGT